MRAAVMRPCALHKNFHATLQSSLLWWWLAQGFDKTPKAFIKRSN